MKVQKWINKYARYKESIIVGGDLNCCLKNEDRTPATHLNDKSRKALQNVLQNCELIDAWSDKHYDNPGYTYVDKAKGTKSRLDYMMVSDDVMTYVNEIELCKCPFTPDHLALYMNIVRPSAVRGSGYWKMNSRVLGNDEFKLHVQSIIENVEKDYKKYSAQKMGSNKNKHQRGSHKTISKSGI